MSECNIDCSKTLEKSLLREIRYCGVREWALPVNRVADSSDGKSRVGIATCTDAKKRELSRAALSLVLTVSLGIAKDLSLWMHWGIHLPFIYIPYLAAENP